MSGFSKTAKVTTVGFPPLDSLSLPPRTLFAGSLPFADSFLEYSRLDRDCFRTKIRSP
jgi:hypothetical protein